MINNSNWNENKQRKKEKEFLFYYKKKFNNKWWGRERKLKTKTKIKKNKKKNVKLKEEALSKVPAIVLLFVGGDLFTQNELNIKQPERKEEKSWEKVRVEKQTNIT